MTTLRVNKMETVKEGRLLVLTSLPIMFSMMISALYNIVDSIFIARYSEKALSAISLAFPMQTLMIALGIGTCVGISALFSRTLGQKNFIKAQAIVQHGALLCLFSYLVTLLFGIFLTHKFFSFQTVDQEIINHGITYLSTCMIFSLFLFNQQFFEKLLQATGRSFLSMISQVIGAIVNILLDPILIFGLLGFPSLGVLGAAIATIIGQFSAFIASFLFYQYFSKENKLLFKKFKFDLTIVKEIYKIGLPAIVMQSIGSITTFLFNGILLSFTTTAIAVYGIYYKLQNFIFMPIYGLMNGMLPIMAYNYGANQKDRVLKIRHYALLYMLIIMGAGTLLFQVVPNQLLDMFNASIEIKTIGIPALQVISTFFIFEGYCLITQTSFQALGKGLYSLICSLIRQIIILLPVAFLLSLTNNINYLWLAFPITGIISSFICLLLWKHVSKKVII